MSAPGSRGTPPLLPTGGDPHAGAAIGAGRAGDDDPPDYGLFMRVMGAYSSWITKAYLLVRFSIIREIIADILSNLPERGLVLNLGSGIGLFDIYCASRRPDLTFVGVELNPKRVELSAAAARRVGVSNVTFLQGNVASELPEISPTVVIALDVLHHLDDMSRDRALRWVAGHLEAGGTLFVKDISTRSRWKVRFTKLLDDLMTGSEPVYYFGTRELKQKLDALGFVTTTFHLWDYIPFPHIIYVAHRR